ncbi:MAG: class I SAM-dependent methyltransferase [Oscillospiraceae bacterium]|nr:class I SAM-dependent methyltransferase [Oscillospiraceae bacterium]
MSNQNIYDNEEFFNGYKELREKEICLNDLLEQPAMSEMIPDLKGKTVLDLGCGYGKNCIDFVNRGAEKVIGIDISEKMLEVAKTESSHEKISYIRMSMTDISSLNMKFDFVYSSLALHYIEDFPKLMKDISDLLTNGGQLLFSQEHPIMTAAIDKNNSHFNYDENKNRVSYTFSDYNRPGQRKVYWYVDGVIKYHRPMGQLLTDIIRSGLALEEIVEPVPSQWAIDKLPTITKEFIKPNFLIVKAVKR